MLHAMLEYSYENVSFYHRKFRNANVKPDDIKKTEDLTKIPTTTKKELQSTPLNEILPRNVSADKCIKRKTSGSTGIPLTVILDTRTASFRRALWSRAYVENGLKIWDKLATIGDPHNFPKKKWPDRLQLPRRRYISVFDDAETQLSILEQYKPNAVRVYPSSMTMLANLCKRNRSHFKPRLIFATGETLSYENRKFIDSIFESRLLDIYASLEFGLLAWECRSHIGYHVNVDSVLTEYVQNDAPVAPDERGEIICTGLVNYAMPLIRYRLGDVCIPTDEECTCGVTLPLIKTPEGRADDFLVTVDGRLISPMAFSPYPFEDGMEGVKQFRVIQEKRDKLTIQLALEEGFSPSHEFLENARNEIQRLFGKEMRVEFEILDRIDLGLTGKLNTIISRVDD